MKKQSGFSLIELLLVIAIIGIISAIAIPTMLGQRARARDTGCKTNADNVIKELIAAIDKAKEEGVLLAGATASESVTALNTNIVGTGIENSLVPMMWREKNPWPSTAAASAFSTVIQAETNVNGADTYGKAVAGLKGQVQIGYGEGILGTGGVTRNILVAAVWLNNQFKGQNPVSEDGTVLPEDNVFTYYRVANVD